MTTLEIEKFFSVEVRVYEVRDEDGNDLDFEAHTDSDGDIYVYVKGTHPLEDFKRIERELEESEYLVEDLKAEIKELEEALRGVTENFEELQYRMESLEK